MPPAAAKQDPRETQLDVARTNRAAIFYEHGGPENIQIKELDTVQEKELLPGEALVRVIFSGVCHSDLHALNGDLPVKSKLPLIGGHEGAGVVVALGPGADEFVKIGDRVGIKWVAEACLQCHFCLEGHEVNCPKYIPSGYFKDGTFQQYTRHSARYLTQIPAGISLEAAASVLCAGLTVYRALREADLRAGQWVAIPGSGGGLGHLGVQYARYAGYRVIGIDTGEDKKKLSLELGCEAFVDFKTSQDIVAEIKGLTGGIGVHAAMVASASPKAYELALSYIRARGTLVIVGMPAATLPVNIFAIVNSAQRIVGSAVGNRRDANEALEIAAQGHVQVRYVLKGLSDLAKVYDDMAQGRISGRVVLDLDK